MSPAVRRAKREKIWLLLGIAGGTGAGKTNSAMRLASGITGGQPFGVVDTENGRASHYADDYTFDVVDLTAPFTPERYQESIEALVNAGHTVVVVDSATHEWDGIGGLLEWHDEEMGGREANNLRAWIKPKRAHRKFVNYLLQVDAHIILCFRAAERVEVVEIEDPRNPGRTKKEIVPKRSLTGLDGWMPISEKTLPFELTLSLLMTPDRPGYPKPIKLQDRHRPFVPLDRPITEATGRDLAKWAAGDQTDDNRAPKLVTELLAAAEQLGKREVTQRAIAGTRARHAADPEKYVEWLETQLAHARHALEATQSTADADLFSDAAAGGGDPTPEPQEA